MKQHRHTDTYQHINSVVLYEALGELPHVSRTGHVNDVDVNVLRLNRKMKP